VNGKWERAFLLGEGCCIAQREDSHLTKLFSGKDDILMYREKSSSSIQHPNDPYSCRNRRSNTSMPKLSDSSPSNDTESRLEGLRHHAAQQKQATLERLHAAIVSRKAKGKPITVHTVRAESGLDYKSYARSREALALFQEHSIFLVARRTEARGKRKIRTFIS